MPRPSQQTYHVLLALFAGALALSLYVTTAAPWITWAHDGADGGDLIAAAMTWGVPHPSGYPTYCLLGRLFAVLPLGSVARRFNLFSATMAAATVSLLFLSIMRLLVPSPERETWIDRIIALSASLAFATSPLFWSQAIIAEVYAPLTFFFASCLYLALRRDLWAHTPYWALLGATFGLGLGMHLSLIWALPGLALLLWKQKAPARLPALSLGAICGLSVYLYLPLAARNDPPINWGAPHTLAGFWWVASGKLYQGYLFALPAERLLPRLGAWSRLWLQQYTPIGTALALNGLASWIERKQSAWAWATGLMFLAYALYAITYDTSDSYVYLIPAFLLTALWMAEGTQSIMHSMANQRTRPLRILSLLLLGGIPLWSLIHHYRTLDLSHDNTAAQWVEEVFRQLPKGAILITGEDRHTFTLDYVRWVEGRRQDLIVIDGELLYQPWYIDQLTRRYPSLRGLEKQPSLVELVAANLGHQAIYASSPRQELAQAFVLLPCGALWRINGLSLFGADAGTPR